MSVNTMDAPLSVRGAADNSEKMASSALSSFERMIAPHRRALFAVAQRLTGNVTDAEDLVQDTLIRAYSRRDQLQNGAMVSSWLHTILRHLFFNRCRTKRRRPQTTELTEYLPLTERGNIMESAERAVTRQMEHQAVLEAVVALPSIYREVVVLADIEQLPYDEISQRLGIPPGTVRSRIVRGRQRLQRALYTWRQVG